jgi:hypothetical protein
MPNYKPYDYDSLLDDITFRDLTRDVAKEVELERFIKYNIDKEKVKYVYIKDMSKETGGTIFFFEADRLITVVNNKKEFTISKINNSSISRTEYTISYESKRKAKLKMRYEDGTVFELDSQKDAEEDKQGRLSETLKQIYEYLS